MPIQRTLGRLRSFARRVNPFAPKPAKAPRNVRRTTGSSSACIGAQLTNGHIPEGMSYQEAQETAQSMGISFGDR